MAGVGWRRLLRGRGLGRVDDALPGLAAPAIRMIERATQEGKIPVGASKLGGGPDPAPGLPVLYDSGGWNQLTLPEINIR